MDDVPYPSRRWFQVAVASHKALVVLVELDFVIPVEYQI